MNARSIAMIAMFAALAIILNSIKIPTIYWPGMMYTLCDIPVVIALIIFGFKVGILVEILHIAGQLIFFPAGPPGFAMYPMGLIIMPLMFSGIYLASRLTTRNSNSENRISEKKKILYTIGLATAFRGGLMPIVDYGVIYHILLPLVLGIAIPEAYIAALLPAFVLYNVTSTLYVIPVAYFVARRASRYLGIETHLPM